MSLRKLILVLIFLKFFFIRVQCKETETTCFINGRKSLNVVNERFLSFSIDPVTLLTGSDVSSSSMRLAQHLSPAFIRIAGPSTEFMQFSEDEKTTNLFSENATHFTVTPLMWKTLNDWIKNTNLTPVVAINDESTTTNRAWNPKTVLPFIDVNEKMNFTCYWQLGCDCGRKTITQYKEQLLAIREALDVQNSSREISKIVGSDLSPCFSNENPERTRKTLEDLDDVAEAIFWEPELLGDNNVVPSPPHFAKSHVPVWLTLPKATHSVTFSMGLLWAKQIGEAAKAGYEVVFRQPRFYELFTDTPVYWISLIYKTLMGRNVLEVRTNSLTETQIFIYAHCTKKQNNYAKQGAMTVFIVNNGSKEHTASLRVADPKSIEVQSYIITSDEEESMNTYLNGEVLTLDSLDDKKFQFVPKYRRVRVNKLLSLNLPAKSVGFFVLPSARVPVCINREDETQLLMEELQQDQDISFSEDYSEEEQEPQLPEDYKRTTLNELYNLMHQELEADEKYFKENNEWKNKFQNLRNEKETANNVGNLIKNAQTTKEVRQYLINKNKAASKKESDDKTTKLEIIFKERTGKEKNMPSDIKIIEIELTDAEIKKILTDRAKSRVAEKNIEVTSKELENLMNEATENLTINKDTATAVQNKRKRFVVVDAPQKKKVKNKINKNRRRNRRDINMELLMRNAGNFDKPEKASQKFFMDNREIETTIRKDGEKSEELLSYVENDRTPEVNRDVFTELESSLEKDSLPSQIHSDDFNFVHNIKPFDTRARFGDLKEDFPCENHCKEAKYLDERIEFLMEPVAIQSSVEDDLRNYHTFHENFRSYKAVYPRHPLNNEVGKMETRALQVDSLLSRDSLPLRSDKPRVEQENDFSNSRNEDFVLKNQPNVYMNNNQHNIRYKRDTSNLTKSDIKNYKRFMADQLRVMKQARKTNKPQNEGNEEMISKNLIGDVKAKAAFSANAEENNLKTDGEHLHIVIGKPYDPKKIHISERRKAQQFKKLKQRLQNRKSSHNKVRDRKENKKSLLNSGNLEKRIKRRNAGSYDVNINVPKSLELNDIEKQYKPKILRPKAWIPQDILKIKKIPSYSVEIVDTNQFLERTAPFANSKFMEISKYKRSVNNDIDSSENAIDDYPYVKIKKLTKLFGADENHNLYKNYDNFTEITTTKKNLHNLTSSTYLTQTTESRRETSTLLSTTQEITTDDNSSTTENSKISDVTVSDVTAQQTLELMSNNTAENLKINSDILKQGTTLGNKNNTLTEESNFVEMIVNAANTVLENVFEKIVNVVTLSDALGHV